jgi:hypothetical protein
MLTSDAYVRFSPDGPAGVDASLRVSDSTFIHCCTYPADAPILSVQDRHVSVTVSVPDRHKVTPGRSGHRPAAGRRGGCLHRRAGGPDGRSGPAADEGEAA